jgi:hypothetical protein
VADKADAGGHDCDDYILSGSGRSDRGFQCGTGENDDCGLR